MIIGGKREARRAYGLDELALAPGTVNIDPDDIQIGLQIGNLSFEIPFLASAMDGAVDVRVACELSRLGGLGVMNGEGLQTRYEDVEGAIEQIITEPVETVVPLIQKMYREPVKPELIARRVEQIKAGGGKAVLSFTPVGSKNAQVAIEAGADAIVIATTVTTLEFHSSKHTSIDLPKFCREAGVPVIVGNAVTYEGVKQLMEAGAACVLIGVGPGAACTTRRVLGLGVPQATAVADSAQARDDYFAQSGRYVPIIADGGLRTGGDVCKAIACGADGVMMGQPIASSFEAPGRGHHWGMATSSANLPRGTRVKVGQKASLEQILFGPATTDNGTLNFVGALKLGMGSCGAANMKEMQQVEIMIAPTLPTEGKRDQFAQKVGQGA
ncbi:MAG: GuaB3 family IMP dehydrogenase-related protein, partial [Armatimonadetes bacterium]|nr:GuaB3 family IMP dehydrogenase-related protein [Armatimonadota bacterium]